MMETARPEEETKRTTTNESLQECEKPLDTNKQTQTTPDHPQAQQGPSATTWTKIHINGITEQAGDKQAGTGGNEDTRTTTTNSETNKEPPEEQKQLLTSAATSQNKEPTSEQQNPNDTRSIQQASQHETMANQQETQARNGNMNIKQPLANTGLTKLSPKEWQNHHDNWLNLVMRMAISEMNPPTIPDFHTHIPVLQPGPDLDINVAPIKIYMTRYNLRIKAAAGENQVELFHQAFCKWFLKL